MTNNSASPVVRYVLRGVFLAIFTYIVLNLLWLVIDPPVSTLPEERENGYFDPMVFARIVGIALVAIAIGALEYWRLSRKGNRT